jgi:hypothetical protein
MKQLLSFVLLLFFYQNSPSQTREIYSFGFTAEKMEKVLLDVESKFKIKYSYVDSLISQKKIPKSHRAKKPLHFPIIFNANFARR